MAAKELRVGGFFMLNHIKKLPASLLSLALMIWRGKVKPAYSVKSAGIEGWADCVDCLHEGQSGQTFGRLLMSVSPSAETERGA